MESLTDRLQRESDDYDSYIANQAHTAQIEEEERVKRVNYEKRMETERIDKINAINRSYGANEIPGGSEWQSFTEVKPVQIQGVWSKRFNMTILLWVIIIVTAPFFGVNEKPFMNLIFISMLLAAPCVSFFLVKE